MQPNAFSPEMMEMFLAAFQSAGLPVVEFGAFSKRYVEIFKETKSEKYVKDIELCIKKINAEFDEHTLMTAFDYQSCELFILKLRKTAPAGAENYLRTIKAMFNKAKDWGYIRENPIDKIKLPKRQKEQMKIITDEERARLIGTIQNPLMKKLIIFNLNSGLRVAEITFLRYRHIDLGNERILIGDKDFTTKSKKPRLIYMNAELKLLCQQIMAEKGKRKDDDFIFGKPNGTPFLPETLSKKFKKTCRDAGLDERIHHHSMRHTFCSNIVNKGGNIMAAKELMGHSDIRTTQRYCHPDETMKREAVKLLDAINNTNNLYKE